MVEGPFAFPWRNTAAGAGRGFREDRLGLTASSTHLHHHHRVVPFFTVALALFTGSMFAKMQGRLQRWLIESLIRTTSRARCWAT